MRITIFKNPKKIDLKKINNLIYQLDPKCQPLTSFLLEKFFQQKHTVVIGAYKKNNKGQSLIGIIVLIFYKTFSGYRCRLEDFVVDEKERGRGVGKKLLKKALALAKNKGVDFIELTSRPERKIANHLYQKMGFKIKKTNVYRYYFH